MSELELIKFFPVLLGILLLVFGRKVFWLFIGAVAFLAVMTVLPRYVHHHDSLIFYVAVGVGVVAAGAGYFLQKIAIRFAGFLAGGFVFFSLWDKFASQDALPGWLPFLIGGILGAILLSFLIEWALIVLSSITGAFLITQNIEQIGQFQIAALPALALLGTVVQAKMKRGKSRKEDG